MRAWLSALLDLVFPTRCVGCGFTVPHGPPLCSACFAAIRIARAVRKDPTLPCVLGAAARYRDRRVRGVIHALKFANVRTAALPLAELLVRYAARFPEFVAARPRPIVVPVPLHPSRALARGFNQSELIAESFAARFKLELRPSLLVRVRATSPQSEIKDRAARKENVRGCFALEAKHASLSGGAAALRGTTIILVDDVVTSGATFFEAATALKARGAERVIALAVAAA